jgi:hypothetical protein
MRKYIPFLLFVLFLAGCNHSENRESRIEDGGSRIENRGTRIEHRASSIEHRASSIESRKSGISASLRHPASSIESRKSGIFASLRHPASSIDTTLIRKLIKLRSAELEIDLREPANLAYLLSPIENPEFSSMILLSHDRSIRINFDNDILDNTDRYYTNGIRFDFISPFLKQSPLSWLMVPYWGNGENYYGVSIGQNMYTPYTTKTGGVHEGDRPYAAYLFIGSFKISNDPKRKFRQTTDVDLGVIGPSSYGDFVQKSFHNSVPTNNEPLGWEYQVQDDLVLNYGLTYEKGIVSSRRMELNLNATGNLGTLYTNMGGGFQFRAGRMNRYFDSYGFSAINASKTKEYSKFQAYVFVTSLGKLVGYDATLEGGMFNKSSIYTLNRRSVSLFTYQGTFGVTLSYGGFRLDVEQFLLSPEFHGGSWHKWVHIGVTIGM